MFRCNQEDMKHTQPTRSKLRRKDQNANNLRKIQPSDRWADFPLTPCLRSPTFPLLSPALRLSAIAFLGLTVKSFRT